MPMQQAQLSAPPDDGGTAGSDTEPVQSLQTEPTDARSSEVLGEEPRHDHHTNRGLMMFHASIALLVVAMLVLAYLKVG